jgi:hypothetical protein
MFLFIHPATRVESCTQTIIIINNITFNGKCTTNVILSSHLRLTILIMKIVVDDAVLHAVDHEVIHATASEGSQGKEIKVINIGYQTILLAYKVLNISPYYLHDLNQLLQKVVEVIIARETTETARGTETETETDIFQGLALDTSANLQQQLSLKVYLDILRNRWYYLAISTDLISD